MGILRLRSLYMSRCRFIIPEVYLGVSASMSNYSLQQEEKCKPAVRLRSRRRAFGLCFSLISHIRILHLHQVGQKKHYSWTEEPHTLWPHTLCAFLHCTCEIIVFNFLSHSFRVPGSIHISISQVTVCIDFFMFSLCLCVSSDFLPPPKNMLGAGQATLKRPQV